MGNVTHAAPHLFLQEVKEKLRASVDCRLLQTGLVMYHALVDPRPAATMARHLALRPELVVP